MTGCPAYRFPCSSAGALITAMYCPGLIKAMLIGDKDKVLIDEDGKY